MRFDQLDDWLSWQESLNPKEIDLGLDRVKQVLSQANYSTSFNCPLIIVAGTNGKGSTVALLESIALAAGLNVCSYTSPHLLKYNERIKINGIAVDDNTLCESFSRIDLARGDTQLTYFEFGTLAAIDIFFQQQADLVIMEVGLGGRLDAVNIMDADVCVLSSVAIDHVDWLGDDREQIGFEKAGIFRRDRPVICGDKNPPLSVLAAAENLHCEFLQIGRDFNVIDIGESKRWKLHNSIADFGELTSPGLFGDFQKVNAAVAIMAIMKVFDVLSKSVTVKNVLSSAKKQTSKYNEQLGNQLLTDEVVTNKLLNKAFSSVSLPGRFQQIHRSPDVYVDVAHNPQAAQSLVSQLHDIRTGVLNNETASETANDGAKTWAIVAMLKDKDVTAVLDTVSEEIDHWCVAGLDQVSRGLTVSDFAARLADTSLTAASRELISEELIKQALLDLEQNQCTILCGSVMLANTVDMACDAVLKRASQNDNIIIFGSFFTVAEAMQYFSVLP